MSLSCRDGISDRGLDDGIETRIIKGMEFTCHGTIVGWSVTGTVGQGTQYPMLQVWRANTTVPGEYYKPDQDISMEGSFSSPPVDCGIFEHTLDEAAQVSVQPGDIIGIELPPGEDQAFDILLDTGGGPLNYVYRQRLPITLNAWGMFPFGIFDVQPQINLRVLQGRYTFTHYSLKRVPT